MSIFCKSLLAPAMAGSVLLLSSAASAETLLGQTDMVTAAAPDAHVMTFYISAEPGEEFPFHSHGGDGIVYVVKGNAAITYPDGHSVDMKAGDVFEERIGEVHGAKIAGDGPVEFIWTIVLPNGAELEIPHG